MLSSVKSFAVSFAAAIIIFGLIGYLIAPQLKSLTDGFLTPQGEDTEVVAGEFEIPEVPDPGKKIDGRQKVFAEDTSFTLLLIGSDYQPDVFSDYRISVQNTADIEQLSTHSRHYRADVIMLVRYSAELGVVMFSAIPSNLMVTASGISMRLGDVLEKKNVSYFVDMVAGIVGMPIDYYIMSRIGLFDEAIDRLGGVKYDVPMNMYFKDEEERIVTAGASRDPIPLVVNGEPVLDENGEQVMIPPGRAFTIDLKKGIQTLDGEKSTWALRFNLYPNGFIGRRDTLVSFFRAFFEQYARDEHKAQLSGLISLYNTSPAGSTNMTPSDFEEISKTLLSYSKYEKTTVAFPGTVSGAGADERVSFSRNTVYSTYEKYKVQ